MALDVAWVVAQVQAVLSVDWEEDKVEAVGEVA